MARDESIMFPNDRIKTWLTNNRVNKESSMPVQDAPASDESNNELDATPAEAELVG